MRAMKDSGVEWIGEIPEEWSIRKLKTLVLEQNSIFIDGDWIESKDISSSGIRYYTSGNVGDGVFKHQGTGFVSEETFRKLNCTEARGGDLIFSRLNLPAGRACIIPPVEKCVVAVDVVVTRLDSCCANKYIMYSTMCERYQALTSIIARGTTMQRISRTQLGNIAFPLPNRDVQEQIVTYLDTKCAEIDKVVEQTRTTIEEYKKLKQAIITEAVTKGVRGPRPMKPSGVEWIGDIPEQWSRSRVGLHYHVVLGKMLCNTQQNDEYTLEPYFCAADIHFGAVDKAKKEMWFSSAEKDMYRVMPGDLLVVEGGAGAGGCAVVKDCETAMYIQNSVMIVRGKKSCSVAYLGYWIESLVKRAYIDVVCNKATIPHFTKDKLSSVPIPLPSSEEQQEIAAYLDTKCAEIDRIIGKKEQLIEEIGSYKKSLIYEYVTGKKQVLYK